MKELPEYIRYRVQCGLIVGLALASPFASLVLRFLTIDLSLEEIYHSPILISIDVFMSVIGIWILRLNHHYLKAKELHYGRINAET